MTNIRLFNIVLLVFSMCCSGQQLLAAGASYVHIFNADTGPMSIEGYSGYHANWLNGRTNGDFQPY